MLYQSLLKIKQYFLFDEKHVTLNQFTERWLHFKREFLYVIQTNEETRERIAMIEIKFSL